MSAVRARFPAISLSGSKILVTRPSHQAESLSRAIERQGGKVIRFPTITIARVLSDGVRAVLERLSDYDLAVFVSPNAVWHGVPAVLEHGSWPKDLRIAVVGPGTAAAVGEAGLSVHLSPAEGSGARGLLARPELTKDSISGHRVLIFRGRGGLATLGEELSTRGAHVCYAEVYERQLPVAAPDDLNARGRNREIDIIVITSADALHNLFTLVGDAGADWLRGTRFLVVSERIAKAAVEYFVMHPPLVASGSSDQEIVQTLVQWRDSDESN